MDELFSFPELSDFPVSLHLAMLNDEVRMSAFRTAIRDVVRDDDVVIDIGSGTGILSFLASQCGAKEIHGIEMSRLANFARKVKEQNFPTEKIHFHKLDVLNDRLPDISATVLVCELFGNFGIEEELLAIIAKAKDAFLCPGSRIVPETLTLHVAPVQCTRTYREVANWNIYVSQIDFTAIQPMAYDAVYQIQSEPLRLLAEPVKIASLDFYNSNLSITFDDASFEINSQGVLHGIAGWFESRLAPGVVLNTGPMSAPTHWGQIFFPTGTPTSLSTNDHVTFAFEEQRIGNDVIWRWSGAITGRGAHSGTRKYHHCSRRGL